MASSRRRTYRRRRRRARLLRLAVLLLIAAGAVLLFTRRPGMLTERIQQATPTPSATAWDKTKVTREVTLPAETWYTIQTGVFSASEAAQVKAGAYTERGAPGTVVQDGGKWRVFIASYGREDEAAAVRQRLGEVQRVETYLYHWTCPELRLRLTGMAGQLDAAEAGLTLFSQAAAGHSNPVGRGAADRGGSPPGRQGAGRADQPVGHNGAGTLRTASTGDGSAAADSRRYLAGAAQSH